MKRINQCLEMIILVMLLTACNYQTTIAIDRAFTINNNQCVMNREGILNTMNDFSADTIANEKAVNSIVIKSCKIDENQAKIILEYNKELVRKAGFTFETEFVVDVE